MLTKRDDLEQQIAALSDKSVSVDPAEIVDVVECVMAS